MSKEFIVETSARHVHLTKEHFETLFGAGKELTVKKMQLHPRQFRSEERVSVVGPKKELANVSCLQQMHVPSELQHRFENLEMWLVPALARSLDLLVRSNWQKVLSLQSGTFTLLRKMQKQWA